MTDDDPNEAYEVVPHEPGPHGPRLKVGGPSSEAAFRLSTFPAGAVLPGMLVDAIEFRKKSAFLIGTIFFASLNGNALRTAAKKPPSRDEAATAF